MLNSKLPGIGTTIFSVMTELANRYDAVNLGQGFPDFEPPARLTEALNRAVAGGHNQYPPGIGLGRLREAIADKVRRHYGRAVDPGDEITVTSGATEAIFAAIAATVHSGDEVIVFDPAYDCYAPAIALQNARAVHVSLIGEQFSIDWQALSDAITKRTRLIIVNSPHNPTGAVLSAEDWRQLEALLAGTSIMILADEVYEHMVFDGLSHDSVLRHPALAERSFVISSFGKTYHCTGWKLGYCIAPPALTVEFRKVHQYLTFASFGPAQHALADMMSEEPNHEACLPNFYQARRDYFAHLLSDTPLRLLPVPGSYFQLVDYSSVLNIDDIAFSRWLIKEVGVVGVPLSPFYQRPPADNRLLRLCFAKKDETLVEAARRLQKLSIV